MRYKLIVFCLVGVLISNAQVPGYMGRKLVVGYSADMLLAASPTANNSEPGGINYTHNLDLEYGIRNRTNFCFGFRYFKTGLYDFDDISTQGTYAVYSPSSKLTMPLKSSGITMAFKFFNQGYLAPVGKYRKLGGELMFNKAVYNKNDFFDSSRKRVSVGKGEYSFVDFCLFYELGIQRILGDRIVINSGVRFGVVAVPFFSNLSDIVIDEYHPTYSLEYQIHNNVNNRSFTHELFNIHVGIGFLAF